MVLVILPAEGVRDAETTEEAGVGVGEIGVVEDVEGPRRVARARSVH